MQKNKLYKFLFIFAVAGMFILSFINLAKLFNPSHGVLVSKKEINNIKNSISAYTEDYNSLKIASIEGNKRYLSITFVNTNYSNGPKTLNALYDTRNNNVINSLECDGKVINIIDSSFVKYVEDNTFIILDSFGSLYNIHTTSDKIKSKLITQTNIRKENLFRYIHKDKSFFLISRDTLSKYNEKILSNNKVLEIKFKNNNYKKAELINYDVDESDFVYSFVLNNNGDIGIIGSGGVEVAGDVANSLLLPSDESYLSKVPSLNKNYNFIDTSSLWVRFLKDNNKVSINESDLKIDYRSIHSLINKKLNLNISSPSNVPIFITDEFILYSGFTYEDLLYNSPLFPVSNVSKIYKNTDMGSEVEIVSSIRNNLSWFNYKPNKYIGFFPTEDGISGIRKNGSVEKVLDFTTGSVYKNLSVFLEDDTIKFKKV